uniref:Uncharacterized protein n=1 Tax=Timema genevievae TaxID=629358 RepID=A0A7R9JPI1_TIMGE|nr:unnamed protein product [Timema genevievae]
MKIINQPLVKTATSFKRDDVQHILVDPGGDIVIKQTKSSFIELIRLLANAPVVLSQTTEDGEIEVRISVGFVLGWTAEDGEIEEFQFLDLTGIDESERNFLQNTLFSTNPNLKYPELPWTTNVYTQVPQDEWRPPPPFGKLGIYNPSTQDGCTCFGFNPPPLTAGDVSPSTTVFNSYRSNEALCYRTIGIVFHPTLISRPWSVSSAAMVCSWWEQ